MDTATTTVLCRHCHHIIWREEPWEDSAWR